MDLIPKRAIFATHGLKPLKMQLKPLKQGASAPKGKQL